MKKIFTFLAALPLLVTAQTYEKIDQAATGGSGNVYSCSHIVQTQDGHVWFNTSTNGKYRLYEYDGANYTYHPTFYDSISGQATRDISAGMFYEAGDGRLFTNGGQNYFNGYWSRTPNDMRALASSHNGAVALVYRDTIFTYINGVYTKTNVDLGEIGYITGMFGAINADDYALSNANELYVANQDTGVIKIDLATEAVSYLPNSDTTWYGQEMNFAKHLYLAQNGDLYVGSWYNYFSRYDGTSWHNYESGVEIMSYYTRVYDFREDSQGRIWLVGYGGGDGFFARVDFAITNFAEYYSDTGATNPIMYNYPTSLEIVDDTVLYAGMYQLGHVVRLTLGNGSGVGVDEDAVMQHLSVYPNPSQNFINFAEVSTGDCTITDLAGKQVSSFKYYGEKIDISSLKKGVYIIDLLTHEGESYRTKWIKN